MVTETEEIDILTIPRITLAWSAWMPWETLAVDARGAGGVALPYNMPGVYEVKRADAAAAGARVYIGHGQDIRYRVKRALVKGRGAHTSADAIRAHEDVRRLVIRWACTDRPATVQEELLRRHRERFGRAPTYNRA